MEHQAERVDAMIREHHEMVTQSLDRIASLLDFTPSSPLYSQSFEVRIHATRVSDAPTLREIHVAQTILSVLQKTDLRAEILQTILGEVFNIGLVCCGHRQLAILDYFRDPVPIPETFAEILNAVQTAKLAVASIIELQFVDADPKRVVYVQPWEDRESVDRIVNNPLAQGLALNYMDPYPWPEGPHYDRVFRWVLEPFSSYVYAEGLRKTPGQDEIFTRLVPYQRLANAFTYVLNPSNTLSMVTLVSRLDLSPGQNIYLVGQFIEHEIFTEPET